mmetsp:Transcript_9588/g.17474  ORF Transcript_9588/g.17474 Transcript_9588/m.17474 type:complete len:614 (-) Transcript_9588:726-2567(-)
MHSLRYYCSFSTFILQIALAFCNIPATSILHHLTNHLLPPLFPFLTVLLGIRQVLITGYTKHTTILQLLCQRNNVKVKETNLTLVPCLGRILLCSAIQIGLVTFHKESLIPTAINVPMLHGMSNITGLDQMLNHNCGLQNLGPFCNLRTTATRPTGFGLSRCCLGILIEGSIPPIVTKFLQVLVHNVSGHHTVHHQLTESLEFSFRRIDGLAQVLVGGLHQQIPCNVKGILFGNRFGIIQCGNGSSFLDKLGIGNTTVVHIMDQSREHTCKPSQRITGNTIGVIMKLLAFGISIQIWGNDSAQELVDTHHNMVGMVKVVEVVVIVQGGNGLHIVAQFFHSSLTQVFLLITNLQGSVGQVNAFCNFINYSFAIGVAGKGLLFQFLNLLNRVWSDFLDLATSNHSSQCRSHNFHRPLSNTVALLLHSLDILKDHIQSFLVRTRQATKALIICIAVRHVDKVCGELTLALGSNLVFSWNHPLFLSSSNQQVSTLLRNVNAIWDSIALHSGCGIHGITKELESRLVSTQDTSNHRTTVKTNAKVELCGVGTQFYLQLAGHIMHLLDTVIGKLGHDHSMIGSGVWKSAHSNITVSNHFHFEDSSTLGNEIKFMVHTFQ